MLFRSAVLILTNVVYNIHCTESTQDNNKEGDLDYYEFRLKHGDPLNYEELIKKVVSKNESTTADPFGTAWEDFTDQTHILIDMPFEEVAANKTTTRAVRNFWNIPEGAQMMTFLGPNETSTRHARWDGFVDRDLTDFTFADWTFDWEEKYKADLTRWQNTSTTSSTKNPVEDMLNTEDFMIFDDRNETFLRPYMNRSSSEEKKFNLEDFMPYTITPTEPPSSTWNPFLIQSEERMELDRIAYEKRMAQNNAMKESMKNNPLGGLGGLFGGLGGLGGLGGVIPINLGGLMGGLRTITLMMGGGTTRPLSTGPTTTAKSTISRKTFKPRPDPKDFMLWKFLDDGSPRPPMSEDEFVRIMKKHGTPFPYHVPSVSIPAHMGDDIQDLMPNENTTLPIIIEPEQLDRINSFINPFIQKHTAMDLLNVDDNVARFTVPSTVRSHTTTATRSTTPTTTTTTTTTTTLRTVQTRIFTTEPSDVTHKTTEEWKTGWSRIHNTIDPFDQKHLEQALNDGRHGEHPWKMESFRPKPTIKNKDTDPRVAALEDEFDNVYNSAAARQRVEEGNRKKEIIDKLKQKEREERAKTPSTKPPYWKEVIMNRPIEPLFDEKTTEAPNTRELRSLFSFLSQGLTSKLSTENPTRHPKYWDALKSEETININTEQHFKPEELRRESTTLCTRTTLKEDYTDKSRHSKQTEKSKYTTPAVDRERLNTLLSFMFPYIQKKSEIFDGVLKDKETSQSTTGKTTEFDVWDDDDSHTPLIPDLGKLLKELNVNATRQDH